MKSYLKFLSRNKLYTAIEAVGLAVSLAFVILIGTYVVQQYEVAHESPQWKRTFVLGSDEFLGLTYWDKEELEMNIPEVQAATRAALLWQPVIQIGEQPVQASGIEADADFFKVFPEYHLLEGSLEDFVGKEDVFISTSLARKINAQVGQTIKVDKEDRTVKGIYADFDGAFFMPADIITNITNSWAVEQGKVFNSIGNYTTWFRVREDADLADVQAKVKALLHKNYDASWGAEKVDAWKAYRMDEAFFFTGSSNGLTRTAMPRCCVC
jgi:putative ABC transport system permease protein